MCLLAYLRACAFFCTTDIYCLFFARSPARRASRKLLERMIEVQFLRYLLYPACLASIRLSTCFSTSSTFLSGNTGRGPLPALYFSSFSL